LKKELDVGIGGSRRLGRRWKQKRWTPLVAPTDPKIPTTPSSNSFA
jgi:hypothetical protein